LWEMFPGHPNLLAASFEPGKFASDYVKKPIYSREGANVSIAAAGRATESPGDYGHEAFIWQAYHPIARFRQPPADTRAGPLCAAPARPPGRRRGRGCHHPAPAAPVRRGLADHCAPGSGR